MSNKWIFEIEQVVDEVFQQHGASKRQRDAFYWGNVFGNEFSLKMNGVSSQTNYLGNIGNIVPSVSVSLLGSKLKQLFVELGFTLNEETHYEKGITVGMRLGILHSISRETTKQRNSRSY